MPQKPSSCKGCPLFNEKMVWGEGSPSANLVIIGQCPGPEEIKEGRPFIGGAGRILDRAIQNSGNTRARAFVTNAVKCYVKPKTLVPDGAIAKCKPLLLQELRQVPNATTILTLGQEAYGSIASPRKMALVHDRRASKGNSNYRLRGCPDTVQVDGRRYNLIPTFHPIFLAYSGFALSNVFTSDVARAYRFARGEARFIDRPYNANPSAGDIQQCIADIFKQGEGGIDIETPIPSEMEEDDLGTGRYLPINTVGMAPGSCEYQISVPRDKIRLISPLLEDRSRIGIYKEFEAQRPVLWGHGSSFDFHHLSGMFSVQGVKEADSLQLFHLLQPDSTKKDIVATCSMYTDLPFWKYMYGINDDLCNAMDTWGTILAGQNMIKEARILDKFGPDKFPWFRQGLEELFWKHQMPAQQITREWEYYGAAYDVEKSDELELTIREVLDQLESAWNEAIPGYSWASSKQLVELFTGLGENVPLRKRSKKDKVSGEKIEYKSPSVDDEALESFAKRGNQVALLVQSLRLHKKAADFLGKANTDPEKGEIGRVYFRAKPHAQSGGRIQTVNENMQQWPEEIAGVNPRLTIIPDNREEDVLIQADFSQIEFWIYSWYAKCNKALAIKESGEYLYAQFYEDIWGEPFFLSGKPRQKKYRDYDRTPAWKLLVAKSWPLGFIYGRGVPDPRVQGLPIDQGKAKSIHAKFHRDYPEYSIFHSLLTLLVTRHKYLQTVFGRIRRFNDPEKDRNEFLAFPGQTSAVDVLIGNALIPLSRELPYLFGPRSRILFTVHDSVITNIKIADAGRPKLSKVIDAHDLIKSSLEAPIPEMDGFTIPCEIGIGHSWGGGMSLEKFTQEMRNAGCE